MVQNQISAQLSSNNIEFKPDGPAAIFNVLVTNLSAQFASFRVELLVAGADPNIGKKWYLLSPEVSTKKPPGDTTEFGITIVDSPIPGVAIINVVVQVSSLEFNDIQRLSLRLRVHPGQGVTSLNLSLPSPHLLVYPRQVIAIPVGIYNINQRPVDALLRLKGINPTWFNQGVERRILIGAGSRTEASFSCQPPIATQAPSGQYPFIIEALENNDSLGQIEGILEVLPIGSIFFEAEPKEYWLPLKTSWLPDFSSPPVQYQLYFKNASNLAQQISISVTPDKKSPQTGEILPPSLKLEPGEKIPVLYKISLKRPWLGLTKRLTYHFQSSLRDQRLGQPDPPEQTVKLNLRPLLPLWLQALLALLLLLLALLLWPQDSHRDAVYSVRFSGVINPVLSGSSDQTVRQWRATPDNPLCSWLKWQRYCFISEGIFINNQPTTGTDGKSVRVLRFRSQGTNQIGVGLENGQILLWDFLKKEKISNVEKSSSKPDRVFDLYFTKDSQYLLSSHGGYLRLWNINNETPFLEEKALEFAIYALAVTEDETKLIIAGQYNRLMLGNWTNHQKIPSFQLLNSTGGSTNDYINSISITKNRLLATADNQGYINLWEISKCQSLSSSSLKCPQLDKWQVNDPQGNPLPLRSLKLNNTGRYLVAAGDDGRILLWLLKETGERQPASQNPIVLAHYPQGINSLDLIEVEHRLLIVSGSEDNQVRLNIYNLPDQL